MPSITKIQQRRGTSTAWAAANPILAAGEIGLDTTLNRIKAGDGVSTWNALPFLTSDTAGDLISNAMITVYGHSYTPVPGAYTTPGKEWPTVLASQVGVNRISYGESGARMSDMAFAAIGKTFVGPGGSRSYRPGKNGLIIIECEMNNALFGPNSTAGRSGFTHGLRTLLAAVTAEIKYESSQGIVSAGWNTFNYDIVSGGSALYSSTDGANIVFSGIKAPAGYVYLMTLANDGPSSPTGTLAVTVDGVTQIASYVGNGQMEAYTTLMAGNVQFSYSPAVLKVPVSNIGYHDIKVTVSNSAGRNSWVDGLLIPPATQNPVIICKDPPVGNLASQANQDAWAANSPGLHSIIDSVAAEFPSASVVDLGPGWDPATMVASNDGAHFHPGDVGMQHIADKLTAPSRAALKDFVTKKFWE